MFSSPISSPSWAAPPDARGRSRFDHRDRRPCRGRERIDAAIGLHDVGAARETAAREAVAQAPQVALGRRLHVGGQHCRAGALVLAPLARNAVRRHRVHLRPQTPHFRFGGAFVRIVGVGVQEADRHRLHALGPELLDDRRQGRQVERTHLRAAVVDSARQFAAQVARHERLRLPVVQVEQVGPVAAGDLQRVSKALGGNQSHLRTPALGERVDDHGGAVGEKAYSPQRHAALAQQVEDAALEVRRSGRRLRRGHPRRAGLRIDVEPDQVRKTCPRHRSQPG